MIYILMDAKKVVISGWKNAIFTAYPSGVITEDKGVLEDKENASEERDMRLDIDIQYLAKLVQTWERKSGQSISIHYEKGE